MPDSPVDLSIIRVSPSLLAGLLDGLPGRLRRRLDGDPTMGVSWPVALGDDGTLVIKAGQDTTVTLRPRDGNVAVADAVGCSCLLSPACVHVVATLRRMGIGDAEEAAGRKTATPEDEVAVVDAAPLASSARAAVDLALQATARLLSDGGSTAGLVLEAELLRAAHAARVAGLHRLGAALIRAVQRLRDLRAERPESSTPALAADVADAAEAALALAAHPDRPPIAAVGTARRAYEAVGALRLTGLCAEPVIAASGHAGVVSHLLSSDGRLWSLPDVRPGAPGRARIAYDGPIDVGDLAISHRQLTGEGLHVSAATASDDHRLGAGRTVQAVRRPCHGWDDTSVEAAFDQPLAAQLERAWPDGLLFLEATVLGAAGEHLVVDHDASPLWCRTTPAGAELGGRDDLRLLACCPGLALRLVGRVVPERACTLQLLAARALRPDQLQSPARSNGIVNLGYDRLQRNHVPAAGRRPADARLALPEPVPDPLQPFRRHLHRVVLGGYSTVGARSRRGVERDGATLAATGLPTAGALAVALADRATDPSQLLRAWTAGMAYEGTCATHLSRSAWLHPLT